MAGNPLVVVRTSGHPIRWEVTEEGCIVQTSHQLNQDGYFRKVINNRLTMVHKYLYELYHGVVPVGKEVHHICRVRECCNVEHLVLKDKGFHVGQHNTHRSLARLREAKQYWRDCGCRCSATELGYDIGVSYQTAARWISRWETHSAAL